MTAASRPPGRPGTARPPSRSRAGPAARWPRSTSPACAGETVLCPSNTFMATPLAIHRARARRSSSSTATATTSACRSTTSRRRSSATGRAAAVLVHIGGHIAFDSSGSPSSAATHGIFLLEDCAHAHGAVWNGAPPGTYGDAGVWSFYATKTISTGEGGMLVSRHHDLLDHARAFRNYGKPDHAVAGLNFRMSEFTAALGARADRAAGGDRRLEERVARDAPRPAAPAPARSFPTG